jgi:hypothetical protein
VVESVICPVGYLWLIRYQQLSPVQLSLRATPAGIRDRTRRLGYRARRQDRRCDQDVGRGGGPDGGEFGVEGGLRIRICRDCRAGTWAEAARLSDAQSCGMSRRTSHSGNRTNQSSIRVVWRPIKAVRAPCNVLLGTKDSRTARACFAGHWYVSGVHQCNRHLRTYTYLPQFRRAKSEQVYTVASVARSVVATAPTREWARRDRPAGILLRG